MPKSDASSPDKLVDRENSACSVDTVESYSGKDSKSKDKSRNREGDLRKLFSLPESEVRPVSQVRPLQRHFTFLKAGFPDKIVSF